MHSEKLDLQEVEVDNVKIRKGGEMGSGFRQMSAEEVKIEKVDI